MIETKKTCDKCGNDLGGMIDSPRIHNVVTAKRLEGWDFDFCDNQCMDEWWMEEFHSDVLESKKLDENNLKRLIEENQKKIEAATEAYNKHKARFSG